MKRIVFLVSTLERSGTTSAVYNILKYINRDLFEPNILTISLEPKNSRINEFEQLNIPIQCLNLNRLNSIFTAKNKFQEVIKQLRPEVIYTNGFRGDYLISKYILDIKISKISNLQADLYDNYIDTYGKLVGSFLAKKEYQFLLKFDFIIPCSQAIAHNLKTKYQNIQVIRNGVDTEKYNLVTTEGKKLIKEKLKLPKNKKIYISVGLLSHRKDPITILNGFINSEALQDSWLVFLGTGDLLDKCQKLASNYNQIKFLGNVSNVADYLKGSDVFISASSSEGLPNSVIEATACGLYCCISNIPQHKEILDMNIHLGCSFKTGNSNDLKKCLNKINQMEFDTTKEQRATTIKNLLSAMKMSKEFQDIFNITKN